MDSDSDLDLNEPSPNELAALEAQFKEYIGIYFRHVVGLAGAYEHVGKDGDRKPQNPFYHSSAVIEVYGQWYLLTAGHILQLIDAAASRPDMKLVAFGLDDTYSPTARSKSPIPEFDFVGARRFFRNQDGLDFGLIHIRSLYRDLMAANGVLPLTKEHWNSRSVDLCDVFLMVGFPEDSTTSRIAYSGDYYSASVKGQPTLIMIDRVGFEQESASVNSYPRFVGQIRAEHNVGNIVGMSGGPVFCFKESEFEPYFLAAVQTAWIPETKTTYACPIPLILEVASGFFKENIDH